MSKLKVEIEVPEWVNWIAVDYDGEVWAFAKKPRCMDSWWSGKSGRSIALYLGSAPKNWKDELYTWS